MKETILFCCILFPCFLMGQSNGPGPGFSSESASDAILNFARKNAGFRNREADMNRRLMHTPVTLNVDFTLPVVFHIVGTDTITDDIILAALQDLNDAFGKSGNYSAGNGTDTKIRFCLARTAPDGGITSGITRTTSFFGNDLNRSIEDDHLKNLSNWDPNRYINIWYVRNIHDENFVLYGCSLIDGSQWKRNNTLGYATMPSAIPDSADGIVVSQFGSVLAHEMGHYLGLYHTFEGGCNNTDCSINGDRVCDTPPDGSWLPSSCADPANSCGSDTLSNYSNGFFRKDVPDQVENFMDYNNWDCANMFTNGQAIRMRAAIVAFRSTLLKAVCNPPCTDSIVTSFTRSITYPVKGDMVNFTNTSYGAITYKWFLNDSLVSSSANYSFQFTDTGKYRLTLKAYSSGACFGSVTDNIIVNCGVTARFFTDKQHIASQLGFATDSIVFTNTSENGANFKWLIQNDAGMAEKVVSSSKNLVYTFPAPGNYLVRLVATNGACSDTTLAYPVPVLDPRPDVRPVIYRADCFEKSKIRLVFGICNSGYTPIAPGAPISFYDADPTKPGANKIGTTFLLPDSIRGGGGGSCCSAQYTEIVDVKRAGLNQVYISFNDKGDAIPVKYPGSAVIEKNYANNYTSESFFQYKVNVAPTTATLLPGDSLQLKTTVSPPGAISSFKWFPSGQLSCTACASPLIIADSSRTYFVAVKSEYNCDDTAQVVITVPPVFDYSLTIDSLLCHGIDSLDVKFTIYNSYKKPLLPKGLSVAFYSSNPVTGVAALLKPIFSLAASSGKSQLSFTTTIKSIGKGMLFGVVNDAGTSFPLKLPNTQLVETDYTNNLASRNYDPLTVTASNGGAVCEGDSLKLFALANNNGASFAWKGPGNFTSNIQNPVIKTTGQSMAGAYFVFATLNGCTSTAANTNVVLNEIPLIDASYLAPVCENGTLKLTAAGNASNKYTWQGPANFSSNNQNPSINNISADRSGAYQVFAISANNCKSAIKTVDVKVNPEPLADFAAPDICMPSTTVPFKNQSTISQGSITNYNWDFGDMGSGATNIDSIASPTHTFSNYGKFLVRLKIRSDAGCTSSIAKLYSGIHKQPVANFVSDHPNGICLNEAITFTDKSTGDGGTISTWTWFAGDGTASVTFDNAATPFRHTYVVEGNYSATLSLKNGFDCESHISIPVKIFALPRADAGPDQFVLQGRSTQLAGTASQDVVRLQWSPATWLSTTTLLGPSVNNPVADIIYTLKVENINGCSASDDVLVKILKPLEIPNVFSPNGDGINDVWNVKYLADYPGAVVDIFDRYGKQVFHSIGYSKPWNGTRNGSQVPVGVYYYIITPKHDAATVNGSVMVLR